jgi:Ca2+-binding EF-hand superfamily protein
MKLSAIAAGILAIPVAAGVARAQTPQPDATPNVFLMRQLALAPTLERYLHLIRSSFTRLDADGNGRLDDADLPLHAAKSTVRYSNIEASRVMAADANGDGAVTEAELREKLTQDLRKIAHLERRPRPDVDTLQERVEKQVRRTMAADANRDGRVTRQEAVEFAERQSAYTHGNQFGVLTEMRQALTVAPAGTSALTWPQLEAAATSFFQGVDTDHNGTISTGEFRAVRERLKRAERQEAERRAAHEVRADCALPKPSAAAKMLLLGTSETEALSSVALAT